MPSLNLLDIYRSPVLESEYLHVIEATSYIRVKPKLPLLLKLFMTGTRHRPLSAFLYVTHD